MIRVQNLFSTSSGGTISDQLKMQLLLKIDACCLNNITVVPLISHRGVFARALHSPHSESWCLICLVNF